MLVDEAYAEFSGRTFIGPALDRHRNLVVGRTFAKAHGLAALRIGALVAHPDTLAPLRPLLPPYSLNIAAVRALAAALDDPTISNGTSRSRQESRRLIYDVLRASRLQVLAERGELRADPRRARRAAGSPRTWPLAAC